MPTPECPKCDGRFEEGFTLDLGDHNARNQTTWVEGKPERSFWTGLRLKGRTRHNIVNYRCTRCGFLESYAPAT
jgi:hypothetical protein